MPDRTENAQGILSFPVAMLNTTQASPCAIASTGNPRHEPALACEDNLSFMARLADGHVKLVVTSYLGKRHFKGPNVGKLSGNPKGKNPGDVWEFPNVKSNHPEKTIHPCQFPVELVERLVLSMTNEDDAVLDPYMGVGSSIVAALMHGRRAYGCDIVPEYADIARQRVEQLRAGRLRTRPMGKPIYDPSKPNGGHFGVAS